MNHIPYWLVIAALIAAITSCDRGGSSNSTSGESVTHNQAEADNEGQASPDDTEKEPATPEPPPCPDARRAWLWKPDGGQWTQRCYDSELPRDAALWTPTPTGALAAGPIGCQLDETDTITLKTLHGKTVEPLELDLSGQVLGRGSALTTLGERVLLINGEYCRHAPVRTLVFEPNLDNGVTTRHRSLERRILAPVTVDHEGQQLLVTHELQSLTGELDGRGPFGVRLRPMASCFTLVPVQETERRACQTTDPRPERAQKQWKAWIFNNGAFGGDDDREFKMPDLGRPLSWVFDPAQRRLVTLGSLLIEKEQTESWDEMRFEPRHHVWSIPEFGLPRLLPEPPAVGDGLTLLYDSNRERVVLFDPLGSHSFALVDDRRWEPIAHTPHPEAPAELTHQTDVSGLKKLDPRLPVTREELRLADGRDPAEQFTFAQWPHVAFWDAEADAVVVVTGTSMAAALCRPRAGDDAGTGGELCIKAHP